MDRRKINDCVKWKEQKTSECVKRTGEIKVNVLSGQDNRQVTVLKG
jgi:hypothetical protein